MLVEQRATVLLEGMNTETEKWRQETLIEGNSTSTMAAIVLPILKEVLSDVYLYLVDPLAC